MFPAVARSSPQIIRSVVDFPQPDGPTSVRNSWSLMVRFRSSTATLPPNSLVMPSKRTSAIGSALHRSGGHALDQLALEEQGQYQGWDDREHTGRGHHGELGVEVGGEVRRHHGDRL